LFTWTRDITAKQKLMHAKPMQKDNFYSQKSSFTHGRVIFTEISELFTNLEKHDLERSSKCEWEYT
jgi:hypothetical protein